MNNTFHRADYAAARSPHKITPVRSVETSPMWLSSGGPLSPHEER